MHFGLDFDDTITADDMLWDILIPLIIKAGHQITIVTIRAAGSLNDDINQYAEKHGLPVVFTHGCQKSMLTKAMGIHIDVWIDDSPLFIPETTDMPGLIIGEFVSGQGNIQTADDVERYLSTTPNSNKKTFKEQCRRHALTMTLKWLRWLTR
jgi:hypothetical protein